MDVSVEASLPTPIPAPTVLGGRGSGPPGEECREDEMMGEEKAAVGLTSLLSDDHAAPPPPLPLAGGRDRRRERGKRELRPSGHEAERFLQPPSPAKSAETDAAQVAGEASAAATAGQRWLAFLFLETLALLLFQFVAGMLTGSLALIADLGHSGADVIGYGVNYFVEWRKVSALARVVTNGPGAAVESTLEKIADLVGCAVSTLLLSVATVSATAEATKRLQGGAEIEDVAADGIGAALLAFSVVSTLANSGTLFIYSRWVVGQLPSKSVHAASQDQELALVGPPVLVSPTSRERSPSAQYSALDSPEASSADRGDSTAPSRSRQDRTRQTKKKLNLTASFSAGCKDQSCADAACCSSSSSGTGTPWTAWLHMLVHPGCEGSHGAQKASDNQRNSLGEVTNLNVSAAMLHLIADVFRGITILVTAVLIEASVVDSATRADAICALVVAAFVAMGSVALLHRMLTALKTLLTKGTVVQAVPA